MQLIEIANHIFASAIKAGQDYARNNGRPFEYNSNDDTMFVIYAIESLNLPRCEGPVIDWIYRLYIETMKTSSLMVAGIMVAETQEKGCDHDA